MSVYSISFSPTGGTDKVMNILGKEFHAEHQIDLTKDMDFTEYHFCEEDICLIGVPSYGGRVPEIAVNRIKKFRRNQAKAVLVAVYGNRAFEDTLLELKQALQESNFRPVAAIAANAEHSIMRQFGAGRPDAEDVTELKQFAKAIKDQLKNAPQIKDVTVPGSYPYREFKGLPLKPKAGKSCNKCGLCASNCPVGAIPNENPSTTDPSKCITCMRCVAICPKDSRAINKFLLFAASSKMKKVCGERKKNELFLASM